MTKGAMSTLIRGSFGLVLVSALVLFSSVEPQGKENGGERAVQILVQGPAADLGSRNKDEMPAEYRLSASDTAPGCRLNLAALQVVRWDPDKSRPLSGPLPLRWYDDAIPYDFPEVEANVNFTDGLTFPIIPRPRWGDFCNVLGDGVSGRLVWLHSQEGKNPSTYRITAPLLAEGKTPDHMPPRGLVGDGSH